MSDVRIGIDIGGTFTDIVVLRADGSLHTKKISSTVDDYSRAIVTGLTEILRASGLVPAEVTEIRHGTTVASNAILERKGARTGLIATEGFRDILEIRTLRMPRLYDMTWQKPPVLVPRYLQVTVDERLDAAGRVQRPLASADAELAVRRLLEEGVEAIAVCLLHAYANPVHERLLKDVIQRLAPDLPCAISSEVLPEIREYERTSTTVIDAYVKPVVRLYLRSLQRHLEATGVRAPLLLMQSNGGLTTARSAAETPVHIVESGPAAGVVGAQAVAAATGLPRIITLDMGGTTAKAALVEDGEVTRAAEYQVGGGIMAGSRLLTGAGYTLKVPAIDLAEVGAGGGSIIRVDAGGSLRVGPESAGATPGPVCYDQGGEEPDGHGCQRGARLSQSGAAGRRRGPAQRGAGAGRAALPEWRSPLGLELEHAAFGAHLVAASNMIRAIRAVSIERGRDPRGFTLFAFGGNGPVFAAGMAASLGMKRVIVPPAPGVFSSFGLLCATLEHHYSRSFRTLLRAAQLHCAQRGVRGPRAAGAGAAYGRRCARRRDCDPAARRPALSGADL